MFFLDPEPEAQQFPEVTFVKYSDRVGWSSSGKNASASSGRDALAKLAKKNKKWLPKELTRGGDCHLRQGSGNESKNRSGNKSEGENATLDDALDGDDDPNVNDPNVTIWRAPARRDVSRLDRLARMEENDRDAHDPLNDKTSPEARGKRRRLSSDVNGDEHEKHTETQNDEDLRDELKGDPGEKDQPGETRKKNAADPDDEPDANDGPDDDFFDDEDDYQQAPDFDDDDGYDDDFGEDKEGGDAFF